MSPSAQHPSKIITRFSNEDDKIVISESYLKDEMQVILSMSNGGGLIGSY